MDFWVPVMFEPEDQILDIARAVEQAGMRGIALQDHIAIPAAYPSVHPSGQRLFEHTSNFVDPLITAANILAATKLDVLSYVYVLTMREPLSVAKQVATLSILAGGSRFKFGVGVGWLREEIELFGHDARVRGRRMDEMLEIIRRFWHDGTVEFHGEFFDFGPTGMYPQPSPPPPVWVGGHSDEALARAARADGWMGMTYDADEMWRLLDRLAELRKGVDHPVQDRFEVFVSPNTAPTRELYEQMGARGVTSTLAMPWWPGDRTVTLDDKRRALDAFASTYMAGR